jgi:hypothetical protein
MWKCELDSSVSPYSTVAGSGAHGSEPSEHTKGGDSERLAASQQGLSPMELGAATPPTS